MRNLILTSSLALALAGGVAIAAPGSAGAEAGCKAFGQAVAADAQLEGPFGQTFDRETGSPGFYLQQAKTKICQGGEK